jgi:two-component system sensor histidine kinase NreB
MLHTLDTSRYVLPTKTSETDRRPLTVANHKAVVASPRGRRSRLSRDLHDGVGQSLNTLLVEIRVAMERGHAGRDDLLILEREAQKALESVRALAYGVRRQSPLADPIRDAERYGRRLLAVQGAGLRWIDDRSGGSRLGPQVASELAWAIRESITNAAHHGRARSVEVRLTDKEGRVRVTVRDDGVGFEPDLLRATPEGRGLGLLGNAERMAGIGGIFTIRSRRGDGTVVVLEAPRFLRRSAQQQPAVQLMPQSTPVPATAVAAV